jgi:hypothetical protein
MEVICRNKLEINDIDGYHSRKFLIFLSGFNAIRVFAAPVKQTPFIHIAKIAELHFNIHSCAVVYGNK